MQSKFFAEPRALLLKISLPSEGVTKTVLMGFGATLADVREKLMTKLVRRPKEVDNWAFLLTKDIEQMWLDDKVSLKAYNIKDGDTLEFKPKARLMRNQSRLMGPWMKAAPKTTAIYEHQLDKPHPTPSSPTQRPKAATKTSTDMLFDEIFEDKESTIFAERPSSPTSPSPSFTSVTKRRNSVSRRKSSTLAALLQATPVPVKAVANASIVKSPTPSPVGITKTSAKPRTESTQDSPFSKTIEISLGPTPTRPSPPTIPTITAQPDELTPSETQLELTTSALAQTNTLPTRNPLFFDADQATLYSNIISDTSTTEIIETPTPDSETPPNSMFLNSPERKTPNSFAHLTPTPTEPRRKDSYVRQQISKFEENAEIREREKKNRRKSRTVSDARLSMMAQRTAEMEQQFSTYISALTESLEKSEKKLDTVQDLLFRIVEQIDLGKMDLKGARRHAKKALDVILADAKRS